MGKLCGRVKAYVIYAAAVSLFTFLAHCSQLMPRILPLFLGLLELNSGHIIDISNNVNFTRCFMTTYNGHVCADIFELFYEEEDSDGEVAAVRILKLNKYDAVEYSPLHTSVRVWENETFSSELVARLKYEDDEWSLDYNQLGYYDGLPLKYAVEFSLAEFTYEEASMVNIYFLCFGLGSGSFHAYMSTNFPESEVVTVEPDLNTIDIANKFFDFDKLPRGELKHDHPLKYLKNMNKKNYKAQVIYIDISSALVEWGWVGPPHEYFAPDVIKQMANVMPDKGVLLIEVLFATRDPVVYQKHVMAMVKRLKTTFKDCYPREGRMDLMIVCIKEADNIIRNEAPMNLTGYGKEAEEEHIRTEWKTSIMGRFGKGGGLQRHEQRAIPNKFINDWDKLF